MYGSAHVVAARGSRLPAGATAVVPLLRCRCRHGVRQLLRSSSLERAATTEVFPKLFALVTFWGDYELTHRAG